MKLYEFSYFMFLHWFSYLQRLWQTEIQTDENCIRLVCILKNKNKIDWMMKWQNQSDRFGCVRPYILIFNYYLLILLFYETNNNSWMLTFVLCSLVGWLECILILGIILHEHIILDEFRDACGWKLFSSWKIYLER